MRLMPRLSVLHVGKFYPPAPGGMERIVQLLCEGEQVTTDSRVLVANTANRTTRGTWQGVDVTRIASMASIGSVGVCPGFPLAMWRAKRDLTVLHEPNPLAIVSDWLSAQRGPLVVWFHSEVIRPQWKYRLLYRPFLRRVLRRASRIVVSSPNLVEHAAELRDFGDKCVVIPFGIDVERLRRTPTVDRKAAEIVGRFPGPRILFLGRLVPYKGVDVLLQAMRSVNATAIVVGDGPLKSALESQAASSGIASRVHFLGHLGDEEVIAHLHACDVFVLPSVTRAETFGVVQLEAMACGKPVVSTDLPTGVPWVNRHQHSGLVVPPRDAKALASALTMLVSDPSMRQRMGEFARRRVEQEFLAEQMAHHTAALYRDVSAGLPVTQTASIAGAIT
ncbi:MAG: glycosyltransferase [Vicinamibacterales bacterium]